MTLRLLPSASGLASSAVALPMFVGALLVLSSGPGLAADSSLTDAQKNQVERLRAEVAGSIHLRAFDLLDELVVGWRERPVFAVDTPVILAGVTVPLGFGSGLEALIETHFAGLVLANPEGHVQLSHCPPCTALVVHSGPEGTIVGRGVDQPNALEEAGIAAGSRHALFLDFEAEGTALVLRARITSLEPTLPIVYARSLSTTTMSAPMLRAGARLKTAAEARQEYLDALEGRGTWVVPIRLGIRAFGEPPDGGLGALPLVSLQAGVELALTQARAWTGGVMFGVTWLPEVQTGWLVQGRIARLLTGDAASLTYPDLYAFVGGSVVSLHGPGALQYRNGTPTIDEILAAGASAVDPQTTYGAAQVGLELRVKNRIALAVFAETAPTLYTAESIGSYVDLLGIRVQIVGAEVSFCF